MKSLGRLFVVTGICLLAASAFASDYPVASAPGWTTTLVLWLPANATQSVTVRIPQYLTADRVETIAPGKVSPPITLTVSAGFGFVTLPDNVKARITYDYNGATSSSYGPIHPAIAVRSAHYVPVINDGVKITVVSMLCSVPTPVTITPRNGAGVAGAHESTSCTPPASQYRLQQQMASGSVDLAVGDVGFNDGSAWPPLAAVIVTSGKPDHDTVIVEPEQ
jgi:hypothetical protein